MKFSEMPYARPDLNELKHAPFLYRWLRKDGYMIL